MTYTFENYPRVDDPERKACKCLGHDKWSMEPGDMTHYEAVKCGHDWVLAYVGRKPDMGIIWPTGVEIGKVSDYTRDVLTFFAELLWHDAAEEPECLAVRRK